MESIYRYVKVYIFTIVFAFSLLILFMPKTGVPTVGFSVDKPIHCLLFLALTWTALLAFVLPEDKRYLVKWAVVGILLSAYAGISEVLQGLSFINRSVSAWDFVWDVIGVAAGMAAYFYLQRQRPAQCNKDAR